ncbi:MAG: glycine cleavage system protein GcvH [Patescibacteria group bacterium]|nr:glycine cleavage system protein GcvH [Patescibacteria group bacterium]
MTNNNLPNNLLYNQDYSWARIENNTAVLGVIKPAADKVKEFVFIKLPQKGQRLKKGETYVSLEALKWSGHLGSPLSGEITEVNDPLFDEPSIINKDPYGEGWIAKIKISNQEEVKKLIKADKTQKWVESDLAKNK